MDDKRLFEIIQENTESEYLDFKKEIYDISSSNQKEEFLKDILAMANSGFRGEKYIIFGVKEKIGSKDIIGINTEQVKDQATYQQLIRENIEPDIRFEMKTSQMNGHHICCFIINGNDRPYIIKKKFGNINQGLLLKRINTSKVPLSRRNLDEIYEEKENALQIKLAKLRWEQNEYSKELLLIRMIKNNYNYISSKINEFEYNVNGFISEWEEMFRTRDYRYAKLIKIGKDTKDSIDKIAGYHIKSFDTKILFNILAECKYEFYENYVEMIEKINSDFVQALQYERELSRFDFPQGILEIEKEKMEEFISNLKKVTTFFPKKSTLIFGEPCCFFEYYKVIDNRIDELQMRLDKVYTLMEEVNQRLFTVPID